MQNQDRISAAIKTATTRLLCAARSACGIGAVALAGFAGSVAPAWSQSCIDQMDATKTEVLALIAESEGSDSIRVQCEYLVKALVVQLAFLTKCPEADPTGQSRESLRQTRAGAANCVATF